MSNDTYDEFGVNTSNSFNTPKMTRHEKIQKIADEIDTIFNDRVFDILREDNDFINSFEDIDEYIELETEAIQRFAKGLLD